MAANAWTASGGTSWVLLAMVVLLIMVFFTMRSTQLRRRASSRPERSRREERRWRSYGRAPAYRPAASALPRGVSPSVESQKRQLEELRRKGRIDDAVYQRVLEKLEREAVRPGEWRSGD